MFVKQPEANLGRGLCVLHRKAAVGLHPIPLRVFCLPPKRINHVLNRGGEYFTTNASLYEICMSHWMVFVTSALFKCGDMYINTVRNRPNLLQAKR